MFLGERGYKKMSELNELKERIRSFLEKKEIGLQDSYFILVSLVDDLKDEIINEEEGEGSEFEDFDIDDSGVVEPVVDDDEDDDVVREDASKIDDGSVGDLVGEEGLDTSLDSSDLEKLEVSSDQKSEVVEPVVDELFEPTVDIGLLKEKKEKKGIIIKKPRVHV